jgi:hypothetical protein
VSDLEAYTRHVGARSLTARFKPGNSGFVIGEYEGLTTKERARLRPRAREKQHHHAGFLFGHLTRWLHERGWALDEQLMIPGLYAASVATPEAQAALDKKNPIMRVHVYAALGTEKKRGLPLTETEERMLFGWLCEAASMIPTPDGLAQFERLRAKRHEKYRQD